MDPKAELRAGRMSAALLDWMARSGFFVTRARNIEFLAQRVLATDSQWSKAPPRTLHALYSEMSKACLARLDELTQTRRELTDTTSELCVAQQKILSQESQVGEFREELIRLRNALSSVQGEFTTLIVDAERERDEHWASIEALESALQRERDEHRVSIEALESALEREQKERKTSVERLTSEFRAASIEIERLREKEGSEALPEGAERPPRSLAAVIWDINARLYTESHFLSVREPLERNKKNSDRQAVTALEKLRHFSDEQAINQYFLAMSDRLISPNHHLPGFLKYSLLRKVGRTLDINAFVETGTFYGDACRFLRDDFRALYTIDIDPWCVSQAMKLSKHYPQIHPLQGDSGSVLRSLAPTLPEPVLFFLDGHFTPMPDIPEYGSMSSTTFGTTPVLAELDAIATRGIDADAVIIDDVGCFENHEQTNYPAVKEVMSFCKRRLKSHRSTVLYGMFFIMPEDSHIQVMGHDL